MCSQAIPRWHTATQHTHPIQLLPSISKSSFLLYLLLRRVVWTQGLAFSPEGPTDHLGHSLQWAQHAELRPLLNNVISLLWAFLEAALLAWDAYHLFILLENSLILRDSNCGQHSDKLSPFSLPQPSVLLQSVKPLFCAHHIVIQQNIAPGFQLPPWLVCSLRPRAISLLEPQRTEHLLCANKGCQFCGHKSRAKRTKRSVTVLNNKQIK